MECSYIVQEGELLLNNRRKNRLTVYLMFFFYVFGFLGTLLTFGLTMYLTYIFGSAVISVLSLYCNRQINLFQENLSALHEQIPEMTSWKRWPFLKRHGWESAGWRKVNFYTLKNPQLIFKCGERCLTMELPTCSADFYDLPIVIGIIRMLGFYRYFSKAAFRLKNEEQQKDLLVFYCALMIYRNIFRYKVGTFLMLIGSEFVLASIIFSFFYQSISSFLF